MDRILANFSDYAAITVFAVTYFGVAIGGIPGLALDRTGIALLGAIAMVATSALSMPEALHAIDASTVLLLYALMVVSAQFRVGGFYTWTALKLGRFIDRERLFLLIVMLVTAILSALLVNDVVCLAFTPVLAMSLLRSGLNPIPYLIGMAAASNIGSAATIIGNPQNMLIGQMGRLDFGAFLGWCLAPSLVSLIGAYSIILLIYRKRLRQAHLPQPVAAADWPSFNRRQSIKGLLATAILIALFFTHIPRELTALAIAGLLLCSRQMRTLDMLKHVNWHVITLFCGLFVVIGGFVATGAPGMLVEAMEKAGLQISNLYFLAGFSALLSNIVSNVPAVMLLTKFISAAHPVPWYVLALASSYAGNLLTVGSIANLITIEQARQHGIIIGFKEHARAGVPITLLSLGIMALWIFLQA